MDLHRLARLTFDLSLSSLSFVEEAEPGAALASSPTSVEVFC